jgi:hypothetical protein
MACEGLFAAVLAKYVLEEIGWLITLRAKFLNRSAFLECARYTLGQYPRYSYPVLLSTGSRAC